MSALATCAMHYAEPTLGGWLVACWLVGLGVVVGAHLARLCEGVVQRRAGVGVERVQVQVCLAPLWEPAAAAE